MEKNKEIKSEFLQEDSTFKSNAEATKIVADLAKDVLDTGGDSEKITEADQKSTSEYFSSLKDTLNAINQEIKDCNTLDEKSMLYKQREDVLNRMKEEKENQRNFNDNREDKNRGHSNRVLAIVTTVAIGATGAVKFFLDNKKS